MKGWFNVLNFIIEFIRIIYIVYVFKFFILINNVYLVKLLKLNDNFWD